jgi:hypothetical protein
LEAIPEMIPDEQLFVDRGNQNMVFYFVKIDDISLKRELRKIGDMNYNFYITKNNL